MFLLVVILLSSSPFVAPIPYGAIASGVLKGLTFAMDALKEDPLDEVLKSIRTISSDINSLEGNIGDLSYYMNQNFNKIEHILEKQDVMNDLKSVEELQNSIEATHKIGHFKEYEKRSLQKFADEDHEKILREYHQKFFKNKAIVGKDTLFERLVKLLNTRRICGSSSNSVQIQVEEIFQSILLIEMKGRIAAELRYTILKENDNEHYKREQEDFREILRNQSLQAKEVFERSFKTIDDSEYYNCYKDFSNSNSWAKLSVTTNYMFYYRRYFAGRCTEKTFKEIDKAVKDMKVYDCQDLEDVKTFWYNFGTTNGCPDTKPDGTYGTFCFEDKLNETRVAVSGFTSFQEKISNKTWGLHNENNCHFYPNNYYKFCIGEATENPPNAVTKFDLRKLSSDVAKNYVITGIKFTAENGFISIEIQTGKLLPLGKIDKSTISWKNAYKNLPKEGEYLKITGGEWKNNVLIGNMDKSGNGEDFVVTGVNFKSFSYKGDEHNLPKLCIEVRFHKFDYFSGEIAQEYIDQFIPNEYISNHLKTDNLDLPIRSIPSKNRVTGQGVLNFVASSKEKDAAYHTIPFIDTQKVETISPLSGIGLHYKQAPGFGGFVGPTVIHYNRRKHLNNFLKNV
ncbi:hypothetical protein ACFFRR_007976 [Megaselia abdita]